MWMTTALQRPMSLAWPQAPNTYVLDQYDYVRPYLIDCLPVDLHEKWQVTEHGSTGWGQHGMWTGGAEWPDSRILAQCKAIVKRCDILFAYLDGNDLHGTLIEIGWAMAWDKHVVAIVSGHNHGGASNDYGDLLRHSGATVEWDEAIRAIDDKIAAALLPFERALVNDLRSAVEKWERTG